MADHQNAYCIDLNKFRERLKLLYSHWNKHRFDLWGSSDVVAIATPPASEQYLKSSALNIWLLGYGFPEETIMVFMKKQIHLLCSRKWVSLLEVVRRPSKEAVGVDVVMHAMAKSDDGGAPMDAILRAVRAQSKADGHDSAVVGRIAREVLEGNLLESWSEKLKNAHFQLGDVANGLSDLFAVKDNEELLNVKKAAFFTTRVMNRIVVPKLESVIDEERKVTHSSLMGVTEKAILEPSRTGVKLKEEDVGICYPPIFQSGGRFDLRPSAASNDELLYYDSASVIICAVGTRYKSYCSNVARSFLIDANSIQSKAYEVLLKAHVAAISELKPGKKVSAAYQAALSVVEKEAPEFVANLTKSAGTGIGIEFSESGLNINAKNVRVVKAGMVFNVSLGFQNLQSGRINPKNQNFSLLLADTVVVNNDKPDVVTHISSKAVKDVAYSFNKDDDEEEKPKKVKGEDNGKEALISKTTLRSDNHEISKEELRKRHQAELARQNNEETARRLAGAGSGLGNNRSTVARDLKDLVAYKNLNDLPPSSPRDVTMIQIDQKKEAVLLPMYGSMIPFHVATIRRVSRQPDTNGNWHYIRIIFNIPAGTPPFSPLHDKNLGRSIFLKEVSFRSKDPKHIRQVEQVIKNLRSRVVAGAQRATLVTQEDLQLASKPIRLSDLGIRPGFGGCGRKNPGTLEAHINGFRYSTTKNERVDIMFTNIKHAFFQPAENEMITLLHFHLHNHIMVGTKKTEDVQFYVEVMDVVQSLGGARRSAYDPDEIGEEQRERDRKNKINMDFQSFVNRVDRLWGQLQFSLGFDQPLRELGFHGVPFKSSVFIVPTSTCLVELTESPFLVISLSEIEVVNLERVELGLRYFDMTIVFKELEFKRESFRIGAIPSTALNSVKEWIDSADLKFYEGRLNLNWNPVLKSVADNPQGFANGGCWEFLNNNAPDSESDDSEEADPNFEPLDSDSGSGESAVEFEDEEVEDSKEEEGNTWEELEREARNADRENENESDGEDDRKRRKMKAVGKSRAPPSSSIPKRYKSR